MASGGGFGGGGRGAAGGNQTLTPENAPVHPTGQNPPTGVVVQYWLKSGSEDVALDLLDATGKVIRSYGSKQDSAAAPAAAPNPEEGGFGPPPPARVANRRGVNTFVWNMRYPDAATFNGMILWAANVTGPLVPPGTYKVRLNVAGKPVGTETFKILPDPRIKATLAEWQEQSKLALQIRDRFSEANDAVKDIRRVKSEVTDRQGKLSGAQQSQFNAIATPFVAGIGEVEDSVYQTKNRSGQDPLNYPIRLNNRIGALLGVVQSSDGRPTQQSYDVYKVLSSELTRDITKLQKLMNTDLPKLNAILKAAGLKEIEAKGPIM
jgi:hypothetical protein